MTLYNKMETQEAHKIEKYVTNLILTITPAQKIRSLHVLFDFPFGPH